MGMGNSKVTGGYIVDQAREQFRANFSPVTGPAGIDNFERNHQWEKGWRGQCGKAAYICRKVRSDSPKHKWDEDETNELWYTISWGSHIKFGISTSPPIQPRLRSCPWICLRKAIVSPHPSARGGELDILDFSKKFEVHYRQTGWDGLTHSVDYVP